MNASLEAVLAEMRRAGVPVLSVEQNKHVKLTFEFDGREHTLVLPHSASDRRSAANSVADLRRIIGRSHLTPKATAAPGPRRRRNRQDDTPAPPAEFRTMPDWHEALKRWGS